MVKDRIKSMLKTDSAVYDFIFLCFMVGNDFLPHLPMLEIYNGGIDLLLSTYLDTCLPDGLIDNDEVECCQ